jgi:lipoic acid synthetase
MVGLGETVPELLHTLRDLRQVTCDLLTIGQYLRPSAKHLPVVRYYPPDTFDELKRRGEAMGFAHVEAGPLVRSSYHAAAQESATHESPEKGCP